MHGDKAGNVQQPSLYLPRHLGQHLIVPSIYVHCHRGVFFTLLPIDTQESTRSRWQSLSQVSDNLAILQTPLFEHSQPIENAIPDDLIPLHSLLPLKVNPRRTAEPVIIGDGHPIRIVSFSVLHQRVFDGGNELVQCFQRVASRHVEVPIESELTRRICAGDGNAFEQLFRSYCQPLVNFARRYVNDITVAENLVQDLFLAVWENRTQLDPAQNMKSYLYTVAKNRALKYLRHSEVARRSDGNETGVQPPPKTPEDELQGYELATAIHQAVEALPEKTRI